MRNRRDHATLRKGSDVWRKSAGRYFTDIWWCNAHQFALGAVVVVVDVTCVRGTEATRPNGGDAAGTADAGNEVCLTVFLN